MHSDQVDKIMAVMTAAFDPKWGEAWNRRQVSDAIVFPNTQSIVVNEDGVICKSDQEPAGFILARHAPDETELLLIAVSPEHRRKGIGKKLLRFLLDISNDNGSNKIFLEMRANNPAEQLYIKNGFQPIGKRKQYYKMDDGNRLDAITFCLQI